ncbi:MAG: hypothetical protein H6606_06325 [Flavobacteriales bacterium]|nr:hypothetical protein [Flavobacteriales bacterium]
MSLRIIFGLVLSMLLSPLWAQQGDIVQNLYVSYSNQQLRMDRDMIARSFYHSQDQPVVETMVRPAFNHRQSFAIGGLKSVYTSENYRHDVYAGVYARVSYLSSVLTQQSKYREIERSISDGPNPTTTLTESFSKTWLSFNTEQIETGLSLEAVYRLNRRVNMHYGFRAGLVYPAKVRFTEVLNEEIRQTISTGSNEDVSSSWKLDSRNVHQIAPLTWASDAVFGFDYKILANRPFFVSMTWLGGMVQLKGTEFHQVAPIQGIELRISSIL